MNQTILLRLKKSLLEWTIFPLSYNKTYFYTQRTLQLLVAISHNIFKAKYRAFVISEQKSSLWLKAKNNKIVIIASCCGCPVFPQLGRVKGSAVILPNFYNHLF